MSAAREGSSRSKSRVALAVLRKLKTFFGGASGGMQGGPRRGRSPITGPTLPHSAQASQSPVGEKYRARRAVKPVTFIERGESTSSAFTQTRLFWPDGDMHRGKREVTKHYLQTAKKTKGIGLKRNTIQLESWIGHYAARREIT